VWKLQNLELKRTVTIFLRNIHVSFTKAKDKLYPTVRTERITQGTGPGEGEGGMDYTRYRTR
jgi:hypothetical protein